MIWVMRSLVSCSRPLARLSTGTHGRTHGASSVRVARKPCDGTPMTTTSAERTACSRSAVASRAAGRRNDGR